MCAQVPPREGSIAWFGVRSFSSPFFPLFFSHFRSLLLPLFNLMNRDERIRMVGNCTFFIHCNAVYDISFFFCLLFFRPLISISFERKNVVQTEKRRLVICIDNPCEALHYQLFLSVLRSITSNSRYTFGTFESSKCRTYTQD